MAGIAADGDAPRRLKKMRRRGDREEGRPLIFLVLSFFLCLFNANAFSQDLRSLERAILSGNSEQKRDALYEIKKVATEQASWIAIPALSDRDVRVRATAASAVIYLPAAEAVALLHPLLSDKQEFVRREAAHALGEIGDPGTAGWLIDLLHRDKVIEVRDAAAIALGRIGDTSALKPLTEILEKKPDEDTEFLRRSAARSIGQIAMRQQVDRTETLTPQNFLPAKFKKVPANLRDLTQMADEPGANSGFKDALPVLVRVLSSLSEAQDTRREAAFAIGMMGSPSTTSVLAKYAADPDPYLAEICKEALMKLQ